MTKPPAPSKARIFTVWTRFQKMATRPGGLTREQAIKRAQASIDAMKPDFDNWLSSKLQAMTVAVRRVEAHPGDISLVDDAYGSCCQLRDVGTTMGFELISTISDNLCELLDAIKDGAAYHKETIECHIDALYLTSKPPYCNLPPDRLPEMIAGLRRMVERASNSHSKPPASASK